MRTLPTTFALLLAALLPAAEGIPRIPIGDSETIVLYGDSITEQNLYAAFIENFLITRFPDKQLRIYNYGWSGDTTAGGNQRFARDVAPCKPTLVFVDYGMNDGRYAPADEQIRAGYLAAQRDLAATIKAAGAREVLITTSPIDPDRRADKDTYNEALALMADGVLALGTEFGIATADIFHPMREEQRLAKVTDPAFTLIPDSIHPDPAGHLVMAYHVLRRLDAPAGVGAITVRGKQVAAANGASVSAATVTADAISFELALACLPCAVPAAARRGLAVVPFQEELNRLALTVEGLTGSWALSVGDREVATFTAEQLGAGVDLAIIEGTPWAEAAQRVWDLGQRRWHRHFDAWRGLGMENDPMLKQHPAHLAMIQAAAAYVDALGEAMRSAAKPGTWKVSLSRSTRLALSSIELAPVLPAEADFEHRYPPETAPDAARWQRVPFTGVMDFQPVLGVNDNCVVHARLLLDADRACSLRLILGSDDGLVVTVNGVQALSKNVGRGLRPGDDSVDVPLLKGRNHLLFRVSQGVGGYGLAIDAKVLGDATVAQFAP
ncbi:MAG: SGNH/GDSL hydrolase family protein [Planctomycetes bacterium]|nr:SGNH/GDSL hydrolase family protein [Planctomycetota bacterium]